MIDLENVLIIAQKELRDARRNRWFVLYTAAFVGLSFSVAWMTLSGVGNSGLAGYGRTSASLINLILLIMPLMGLTLGALSLAGERENGTILYLMAQPLTQTEILLGKYLGLTLALIASIGLGFGITAIPIAFKGSANISTYITLLILAWLLASASLSIGYFISATTHRSTTAIGLSLFSWLTLVFFGDLGLMGSALTLKLDVNQLFTLALFNPLQLFKIAAILNLRSNLEVLGPVGVYAYRTYGIQLWPILIALLLLWILIPFIAANKILNKRGIL